MAIGAVRRGGMTDSRFEELQPIDAAGVVVLARDRARGGVPVAIKRYAGSASDDARREYATLSRVRHPLLPAGLDLHREESTSTVVMEYVPGEPLRRSGALTLDEWTRLAACLLLALDRLHAAGVVHCDVKPDNIVIAREPRFRATLVDVGFALSAREAAIAGRAGGTPRYAAPEARLLSGVDARADLYSVGRVLREAAGDLDITDYGAWLDRLDASDPADRWASAADALRDARLRTPALAVRRHLVDHLPYVAPAELVTRIDERLDRDRCVRVVGQSGGGKTSLIDWFHRDARLRGVPVVRLDGVVDDNAAWSFAAQLGDDVVRREPWTELRSPGVDRVIRSLRATRDALVLVDDAHRVDPSVLDALVAVTTGVVGDGDPSRRPRALIVGDERGAGGEIELPAMTVADFGDAMRRSTTSSLAAGLVDPSAERAVITSGGNPGRLEDAWRAACRECVEPERVIELVPTKVSAVSKRRTLKDVDAEGRELLDLLARAQVPPLASAFPSVETVRSLCRAGLITLTRSGRLAIDESLAARVTSATASERRLVLSRRLAELEPGGDPLHEAVVELHRLILSPTRRAGARFASLVERLRDDGWTRPALRLCRLAAEEVPGDAGALCRVELGRTLAEHGKRREGLRVLSREAEGSVAEARARASLGLAERACRDGDPRRAHEPASRAAREFRRIGQPVGAARAESLAAYAAYLRGDNAAACERAAATLDAMGADAESSAEAIVRNIKGVAHVGLQEFDDAATELRQAEEGFARAGIGTGVLLVMNNRALRAMRMGDLVAAARTLLSLRRAARREWSVHHLGLATNNLAIVYRDLGHLHRARAFADEAVRSREALRERYGLASSLSNRATIRIEAGDADGGREDLVRALELFRRLKASREEVTVRKNLVRAWVAAGVPDEAVEAERAALRLARRRDLGKEIGDLLVLRGRRQLAAGDPDSAVEAIEEARAVRAARGDRAGERECDRELAFGLDRAAIDRCVARVDIDAMRARIDDAIDEAASWEPRGHAMLARAWLARALGDDARFLVDVEVAHELLARSERARITFLVATLAAAGALRQRRGIRVGVLLRSAREVERRLSSSAPGLLDRRGAALLDQVEAAGLHPDGDLSVATTRRPAGDAESLDRVLELYRRLSVADDLPPVLDAILEAALDLTGASRAYLMVVDFGRPVVARSRADTGGLVAVDDRFSRSILERAIATGRRLMIDDAGADPTWRDVQSVRDLRLRSVVCLPLLADGEAVGALYIDDAGRAGAFDDDALDLLERFADQAALALARLLREADIRELNRVLSQRVDRVERLLATEVDGADAPESRDSDRAQRRQRVDEGDARTARRGGALGGAGPDHRGERHGQGDRRALDPRPVVAPRRALRRVRRSRDRADAV